MLHVLSFPYQLAYWDIVRVEPISIHFAFKRRFLISIHPDLIGPPPDHPSRFLIGQQLPNYPLQRLVSKTGQIQNHKSLLI